MKKIFLILLVLLVTTVVYAQSSVTLTTYYPAPFGSYDRLKLVPRTNLDSTFCDEVSERGIMYSDSTNVLQFCGSTGWQSLAGVWIQSGLNLYPVDSTANVGIGTTTPASKLDVEGGVAIGTTYSGTTAAPSDGLIVEGNVGIGTTTPEFKLSLDNDGGILAEGVFGAGQSLIATSGTAGTRLLWYPKKSVFRVGSFSAGTWDDLLFGIYSTAIGYNITASGVASTAMGDNTTASGVASTAMGYNTTASGDYSTAMGILTVASGSSSTAMGASTMASGANSTAMGFGTIASGKWSTAMGHSTAASGDYSTAMGYSTTASGNYSTAMGANTTAIGNYSTAMGTASTASGDYSTAMGYNSATSGFYSTAMGYNTTASGLLSIAMGRDTTASGDYSTAMGHNNIASGRGSTAMGEGPRASGTDSIAMGLDTKASGFASMAMGYNTIASGRWSTAMGFSTTAKAQNSIVIGRYNIISGTVTSWIPNEPLFVIGNGNSSVSRNNAMTVLKNGQVGIGTADPLGYQLYVAGNAYSTGSWQSSDKRWKKNITPLKNSLNKVLQLRGVNYEWKTKEYPDRGFTEGTHIGIIAQELEKVIPELVHTNADGYKAVSYEKLAPILLEAIKELKRENDVLRIRIEALEGRGDVD